MSKLGSLYSLISPVFPSISRASIDLPKGDSWVLLDPGLISCPRCDGRAAIAFRVDNYNPMTGIAVYCATESHIYRGVDLGMNFIGSTDTKVKEFLQKHDVGSFQAIEIDNKVESQEMRKELTPDTSSIRADITVDPLVPSVPVPDGYKNVAWLRLHEAQAIEKAYRLEKDISVESTTGKILFTAKFFPSTSKESQKYFANVKAVRIKNLGQERIVGWIRPEEADAVIHANDIEASFEFDHVTYGKGGKVEYFTSDSLEARTYRSKTRLLRRK